MGNMRWRVGLLVIVNKMFGDVKVLCQLESLIKMRKTLMGSFHFSVGRGADKMKIWRASCDTRLNGSRAAPD